MQVDRASLHFTMRPIFNSLTLAALSGSLLSGCVVMTPSPAIEAVNLITSAVVAGSSVLPGSTQNTITHQHEHIDEICIEVNPGAPFHDFLSAMQTELRRNGVNSRLYDVGSYPLSCRTTLDYSAFLDWDKHAFSDEYSPYLIYATFTLRSNGRVLANASYELGQMDKWSPTQSKISDAVRELLAGN